MYARKLSKQANNSYSTRIHKWLMAHYSLGGRTRLHIKPNYACS